MTTKKAIKKIVFIDSGYGGILTCAHIKKQFPMVEAICVLDVANMPYGEKSLEELDARYLFLQQKAKEMLADLVVVACNTLSATSYLRNPTSVPTIDIVSMSAEFINNLDLEEIQLVATPNTIKSKIYPNSIKAVTKISEIEAKYLASKIEEGDLNKIVQDFEGFNLKKDIPIFLGCTHYSILLPILKEYKFYSQLDILTEYFKNNYTISEGNENQNTKVIVNLNYEKYTTFAKKLFQNGKVDVLLQDF